MRPLQTSNIRSAPKSFIMNLFPRFCRVEGYAQFRFVLRHARYRSANYWACICETTISLLSSSNVRDIALETWRIRHTFILVVLRRLGIFPDYALGLPAIKETCHF